VIGTGKQRPLENQTSFKAEGHGEITLGGAVNTLPLTISLVRKAS
jgi:hypothetical protein